MDKIIIDIILANVNAVRKCLRAPDVIHRLNREGVTPLQLAAARPNSEIVELLLRAGASPNVQDRHTGSSPLLHAVAENYEANVRLLIEAGADPNIVDSYGITPLYAARTPDIVAMLLAAGAQPRLPGVEPCLVGAVEHGRVGITKALIAAGADPSAASPSTGWTPLHYVAQSSRIEVLDVLLAAGADALAISPCGRTPLRCVHSGTPQQRHAIIAALVAAGDRNWNHVPTPCAWTCFLHL